MKKHVLFCIGMALCTTGIMAQCGADFYTGFESGNFTPEFTNTGSQVYTATNVNPAVGNYCLEGTGGSLTHLTGLNAAIAPVQPTQVSWWIYPGGSGSGNYVVMGDASFSATNCVVFSYFQGSAGNIRFVAGTSLDYPAALNTWTFIEMRNIDWNTKTFDIYIDGVLQYTGFPFRSNTQNDISNVALYNYNATTAYWDEVTVGIGNPFQLSDFTTSPTCSYSSDGAIDLSVSGGLMPYTFAWSNSANTEDISGIPGGNYTVVVTDLNNCEDSVTITVAAPSPIVANPMVQHLSCFGISDGSIDITPSGGTPGVNGYLFFWNNGNTTEDMSGLGSSIYEVIITDSLGCADTTFGIQVNEPAEILIASANTSPTTCGGSDGSIDITVTDGFAPYQYNWNTGAVTEDISMLTAGTYDVTVTDDSGCVKNEILQLSDPATLPGTLVFPEDEFCINAGPVMLNGGTPAGGSWSGTGVTDSTFLPSAAGVGTHTITYAYTDVNNCAGTVQSPVTVLACLDAENTDLTTWNVYPNPASTYVILNGAIQLIGQSVDILSIDGRQMLRTTVTEMPFTIALENLPAGMYLVGVSGNPAFQKIQVQ